MANYLAVQLDRRGVAEMSCIAGVGGDVPALVRVALSGRPIVGIDGCALHCVKNTLARHGVEAAVHVTLSDSGVKRKQHQDFDPEQARELLEELQRDLPARIAAGRPT